MDTGVSYFQTSNPSLKKAFIFCLVFFTGAISFVLAVYSAITATIIKGGTPVDYMTLAVLCVIAGYGCFKKEDFMPGWEGWSQGEVDAWRTHQRLNELN